MDRELLKACASGIAWWVVFVIVAVSVWLGSSYFEARTYTRLTGHHVTMVDAMFVQLRVSEPLRQTK